MSGGRSYAVLMPPRQLASLAVLMAYGGGATAHVLREDLRMVFPAAYSGVNPYSDFARSLRGLEAAGMARPVGTGRDAAGRRSNAAVWKATHAGRLAARDWWRLLDGAIDP